jgi:hypothetical protein
VNLPWFGSSTEAAEPHQMGGSNLIVFGATVARVAEDGKFLRICQTRLCRMGTRRRQLARGRFHAFLPAARRRRSKAHFYAIRRSLRRVRSVMHATRFRFDSEEPYPPRATADSLKASEDALCSYAAHLPFCSTSEEAQQRAGTMLHSVMNSVDSTGSDRSPIR